MLANRALLFSLLPMEAMYELYLRLKFGGNNRISQLYDRVVYTASAPRDCNLE
jgi:hypothetical protein